MLAVAGEQPLTGFSNARACGNAASQAGWLQKRGADNNLKDAAEGFHPVTRVKQAARTRPGSGIECGDSTTDYLLAGKTATLTARLWS